MAYRGEAKYKNHLVARDGLIIGLYMSDLNFLASSAAYIFIANQPTEFGCNYCYEDAIYWFNCADRHGIVFG